MTLDISSAERRLFDIVNSLAPLAVAVSGGADSTLLAKAASLVLSKSDLLLLHARLPFSPPRETRGVIEWAEKESLPLEILELNLLNEPEVAVNGPLRCYHCKKTIMTAALREIRGRRFANLADGTVTDDFGDYRPGLEATAELGVVHPLAEAGFDKRLTRLLARRYGMPNWNMPASACLASRIPTGTSITVDALKKIAAAEDILANLGFSGCRARHLSDATVEVEVLPPHIGRLFRLREEVETALTALGFEKVMLNPNGYRRGAMNKKD